MEKAQQLANTTYSVIARSCNKLLIGKTFWKNVAMPSILYGINVINMTETDIQHLQRIENGVYRQILGAPKYAPISTLRGEIGASLMKKRIIDGGIQYLRRIRSGSNELLKRILQDTQERRSTDWIRTTNKYLHEINASRCDIINKSKQELKEITKVWDTRKWIENIENKSTGLQTMENRNKGSPML